MSVIIKYIFCIIYFICFSFSQESYPEKLPTKHLNKQQQYNIRYLTDIIDGSYRINADIISESIKLGLKRKVAEQLVLQTALGSIDLVE